LNDAARPITLVFEPGVELLPLIAEALALMPARRRWQVTFHTYSAGLSQGLACACRGVLKDSPEARTARRLPGALVLDLGAARGGAAGGPLVDCARTGEVPPEPDTAKGESDDASERLAGREQRRWARRPENTSDAAWSESLPASLPASTQPGAVGTVAPPAAAAK